MSESFSPQPPQGPGPQDGQPQWPYSSPPPGPYGMPGGGPATQPPGPYGALQPGYGPRQPMPPPKSSRTGLIIGLIAGGGALLLVLVAGVVLLTGGSDSDDPKGLAAPPVKADPVAKGTIVKTIPPDCGVASTTRNALAPDAEKSPASGTTPTATDCFWHSGGFAERFNGGSSRDLNVTVELGLGVSLEHQAPAAAAIDRFAAASELALRGAAGVKELSGLGDEAVARHEILPSYKRQARTTVHVRAANATLKIEYGGADYAKKAPHKETLLSEEAARNGAIKTAQDILKSMGQPEGTTPKVTTPKALAPPIQQLPKACDSVPSSIVQKVAEDASGKVDDGKLFTSYGNRDIGARSDSCGWLSTTGDAHWLKVIIASVPDVAPGSSTLTAQREYRRMHTNTRDTKAKAGEQKTFNALSSPGDEAFGAYHRGLPLTTTVGMTGQVVFRVRNVLAQVTVSGSAGSKPISKEKALNGAYAAAVEVAKRISR